MVSKAFVLHYLEDFNNKLIKFEQKLKKDFKDENKDEIIKDFYYYCKLINSAKKNKDYVNYYSDVENNSENFDENINLLKWKTKANFVLLFANWLPTIKLNNDLILYICTNRRNEVKAYKKRKKYVFDYIEKLENGKN